MSIRNLEKIFKPSSVAVVGASAKESSVGFTLLHNLLATGFGGQVFAVNPNRDSVQGIQAHPTVAALPPTPDLAVIATPAATVRGIIRECGEAGIRGVVIISAGFREAGAEGKTLENQIQEAAAAFPGMRIIGPNCPSRGPIQH